MTSDNLSVSSDDNVVLIVTLKLFTVGELSEPYCVWNAMDSYNAEIVTVNEISKTFRIVLVWVTSLRL